MSDFATVQDIKDLWRNLNTAEEAKVTKLLPLVSDCLRIEANKVGQNLDEKIAENPPLANVAKTVTVDIVSRIMRQNADSEPLASESQSALGYSWSGTYAIPGGGIANAIMKNDLKRLGLKRQRIGGINLLGEQHAED